MYYNSIGAPHSRYLGVQIIWFLSSAENTTIRRPSSQVEDAQTG